MLKPTRSFRLLVGISGLLGVAALAVYYSVPIPVPPPNAGFREIAEFGTQFQDIAGRMASGNRFVARSDFLSGPGVFSPRH